MFITYQKKKSDKSMGGCNVSCWKFKNGKEKEYTSRHHI